MDVPFVLKRYVKISLFNLLIVAAIGIILRYKILYSLPFVDQKFLLHGHSHFAFAGWVTHTLMVLMIAYLSNEIKVNKFAEYKKIVIANLCSAYGMLITFPIQGYGIFSISFSTLSIIVFCFFTVKFWKDMNRMSTKTIIQLWFKASLIFYIISSLGTLALAFMMANKVIHQNWYLSSVYFYLHFQYNGWFFFACSGLLYSLLPKEIIQHSKSTIAFWLFAIACLPAYLLSTLWMPLPLWLYLFVVVAAVIQVIAWYLMVKLLVQYRNYLINKLSKTAIWILVCSGLALTIKLFLQLGSTIPALGQWAFGFRSIVIAYLHLVLLGVISIFLIGFLISKKYIHLSETGKIGLTFFVAGIFLNEFVLLIQGLASIGYNLVPYSNELLLLMAVLIFSGILMLLVSTLQKTK